MSKVDNKLYTISTDNGMTALNVQTRNGGLMGLAGVLLVVWILFLGWGMTAYVMTRLIPSLTLNGDGTVSGTGIGLMIAVEICGALLLMKLAGLKSTDSVTFGAKALKFREKLYEYDSILSFGWEGPGKKYAMTTVHSGLNAVQGLNNAAQTAGTAVGNEIGARSFGVYILHFGKKVFLFKGLKEAEAESVFLEAKRILADRGVYFS